MSFNNIMLLTLSEQIANHIKQKIIDGELKPGQKLPSEKELCEIFDVSRPTVRDALKSLSAINIIESRPGSNGGHFISEISYDAIANQYGDFISFSLGLHGITLDEIVEMRQLVELKSAYLSAKRRTEDDLRKFEKIIAEMNESSGNGFYHLDFEFHKQLAYSTKNKLIIITTEAIIIALRPLYQETNISKELARTLTKELTEVYEAVKENHAELAQERMAQHLAHFESKFKHDIQKIMNKKRTFT